MSTRDSERKGGLYYCMNCNRERAQTSFTDFLKQDCVKIFGTEEVGVMWQRDTDCINFFEHHIPLQDT